MRLTRFFSGRSPGRLLLVLLAASLFFVPFSTRATLDAAQGRVILTVSGNILHQNDGAVARFDRSMLDSLGKVSVTTRTPWTETSDTYEGVLVRDLLRRVGASSTTFLAIAHDDYEVEIQGVDFERYPIILATHVNGKRMRLRDKGPVWMIFPWDDFPELHGETNSGFSVWQMKEIVIR